jgi:hypothetical protein
MNAGEGRFGAALYPIDAGHRQTRRVDAVNAAGGEQVALQNICVAAHETQLQSTASCGIAESKAANAGAHIEHRNRQVTVNDQGDFTYQRMDQRDLPKHARFVNHR